MTPTPPSQLNPMAVGCTAISPSSEPEAVGHHRRLFVRPGFGRAAREYPPTYQELEAEGLPLTPGAHTFVVRSPLHRLRRGPFEQLHENLTSTRNYLARSVSARSVSAGPRCPHTSEGSTRLRHDQARAEGQM